MALKKGLHVYSVQEAENAGLGKAGSVLIDDTSAGSSHVGPFVAITALSNASVDVSDCDTANWSLEDADADFTIPAGVTIFGYFQNFSLNSGTVIAYKG